MSAWISVKNRRPAKYGTYRVRKRARGRKIVEDELLYNGDYWVTHAHGVCTSVEEWLDEEAKSDD